MDPLPSEQWQAIPEGERDHFERELRREIGHPGHPLAGTECRAIARCTMCDDALFVLPGGRYAVVHLTWSGKPERGRQWPTAKTVDSWGDLASLLAAREH
ncbi:MAG TPA: hypothetical protein VGL23_23150 [Chloroflexota bacterium]